MHIFGILWSSQKVCNKYTFTIFVIPLAYEKITLVKSDVTFGEDSTAISRIISRMVNDCGLKVSPAAVGPSPVLTENLAEGIEKLLENGSEGEKYLAEGQKRIDWTAVIQTL